MYWICMLKMQNAGGKKIKELRKIVLIFNIMKISILPKLNYSFSLSSVQSFSRVRLFVTP